LDGLREHEESARGQAVDLAAHGGRRARSSRRDDDDGSNPDEDPEHSERRPKLVARNGAERERQSTEQRREHVSALDQKG
jgi:hypothetical protein